MKLKTKFIQHFSGKPRESAMGTNDKKIIPPQKFITPREGAGFTGLASKTRLFFIFALFLGLTGGLFIISSKPANAATYTAAQVQVIESVANNFYKVSPDQSVTIPVTLTLTAPASLNFDGFSRDTLSGQGGGADLMGVGVGVVNTTTNSTLCKTNNTFFGTRPVYSCSFSYTSAEWANSLSSTFSTQTWTAGQNLSFNIVVDSSFMTKLGITPSDQGTVATLDLYPFFDLENSTNPAFSPPSVLYLDVFNNAQQASSSNATAASLGVTANTPTTSSPQQSAGGDPIAGFISEVIGVILGIFQEIIYAVFSFLIAPVIQAMLSIQAYKDTFVAVIYPGWIIVRNLCDMIFIVALIVIAMATLLRIESYQYKHLLVQLILAALLINFSLVIGQAVLGIADTVQAQFLPANVTVIKSLAGDLMVNNWRQSFFGADAQNVFNGSYSSIIIPFFYLAVSLGSFMVFCAIAVFLVIRICALWVLLMISPVAYACGILPATEQYRKQWWETFLKYAFFTPVMAFFLNMTAVISNTYRTNPILQQATGPALQASLGGSSIATFVFKVASNILLLIFLLAGLMVAEKFSIIGAKEVSGAAKKYGVMAPFGAAAWGAKRGGGYVGRKWNEFTANKIRGHDLEVSKTRSALFAIANPKAAIKGWQKHSEEIKHAAQAKAEAAGLEVAEQRLTGGKKVIPRVLAHEKEEEDKWAKTYMNMSRELVVQTLRKVAGMKNDDQGLAAKRAIIKVAMAKGYIDDGVQDGTDLDTAEGQALANKMEHNKHYQIRNEKDTKVESYTYTDENGQQQTGTRQAWERDWEEKEVETYDKHGNVTGTKKNKILKYNDLTRRALYEAMFTAPNGHMDVAAMRLITEEGEDEGKKTGHFEYLKDVWFNFRTGAWEWRPTTGDYSGANFAKTEMSKMQSRPQAAAAHHSFMDLSDDANIDEAIFRVFATAAGENPSFMQERTAHQALTRTNQVEFLKKPDGSDLT